MNHYIPIAACNNLTEPGKAIGRANACARKYLQKHISVVNKFQYFVRALNHCKGAYIIPLQ